MLYFNYTSHLFQVTGILNDTKGTLCVPKSNPLSPKAYLPNSVRIAVVQRGDCKFSKKAENAAREGYQGIIILDTKEDTRVDRISGVKSLLTDTMPVVFLLHNEALILQDLLREYPNRTATISGICYCVLSITDIHAFDCVRVNNATCESCWASKWPFTLLCH